MTVHHLSTTEGYQRKTDPRDSRPVPENMSQLHYGYRWHPFRLIMYDHLTDFFPGAHVIEEFQPYPHLDPIYQNFIRVKIFIIRSEITWKQSSRWHSPQPQMADVERGATYDIDLRDLPHFIPRLGQTRFHHLTQSFPDDIILPQSRRYR